MLYYMVLLAVTKHFLPFISFIVYSCYFDTQCMHLENVVYLPNSLITIPTGPPHGHSRFTGLQNDCLAI